MGRDEEGGEGRELTRLASGSHRQPRQRCQVAVDEIWDIPNIVLVAKARTCGEIRAPVWVQPYNLVED